MVGCRCRCRPIADRRDRAQQRRNINNLTWSAPWLVDLDLPAKAVGLRATACGQARRWHGREEHHVLSGLELLVGDFAAVLASNASAGFPGFLVGQAYADQPSPELSTSTPLAVHDPRGALFHAVPRKMAAPLERVDPDVLVDVVERKRATVEPDEDVGTLLDDVQDACGVRVSAIHDRELPGHPSEAPQRLPSRGVRDVCLRDSHVVQPDHGVDPGIGPLGAGPGHRRRVEAKHLVARPALRRRLLLDVGRHALDQCRQVAMGAAHLLVQPDLRDARPPTLGHDRHRLTQRQVRSRVEQDQPQQHLRALHLQVRPLRVQQPMLDRELLEVLGQVRHQGLPVGLRGECLHASDVPEGGDDAKPVSSGRLTLVGQSLETNHMKPQPITINADASRPPSGPGRGAQILLARAMRSSSPSAAPG